MPRNCFSFSHLLNYPYHNVSRGFNSSTIYQYALTVKQEGPFPRDLDQEFLHMTGSYEKYRLTQRPHTGLHTFLSCAWCQALCLIVYPLHMALSSEKFMSYPNPFYQYISWKHRNVKIVHNNEKHLIIFNITESSMVKS